MKIYDKVFKILKDFPETRSSDKKLIWKFFEELQLNTMGFYPIVMTKGDFFKLPSMESITRARRQIQSAYPELRAVGGVEVARAKKRNSKGTFVFRENI